MRQSPKVFFLVALCALYFVYKTIRGNIIEEIRARVSSDQTSFDREKWSNFLLLANVPTSVRHWFAYSETESQLIIIAAMLGALEGDDPKVIDYVKKYKLVRMPPFALRAKLPEEDRTINRYGTIQMEIFQNKTDGFYVECGAYEGLNGSTTAFLEGRFNWTGLLIEADPYNVELVVQKRRSAFVVPACLSTSSKPELLSYAVRGNAAGKIVSVGYASQEPMDAMRVQCVPLYSMLLAVNRTTVDFFSLDVEGNEMNVLRSIPYDKLDIKVIMIEFHHIKGGKKVLEDFLGTKGYVMYPSTPEEQRRRSWARRDVVFVKKGSGYKETRDS